jgi:hypothetical protein
MQYLRCFQYISKNNYVLLNTVSDNKSYFNERDIRKADIARLISRRMGLLGPQRLINLINSGANNNFPVI